MNRLALIVVVLVGALTVGAGGAAAAEVGIGSEGIAAGEFMSPDGIAVDQATGNIYLVDRNNQRIDEFDAAGSFVMAWGWGVADGRSTLETCTAVCFAGLEGTGAGQFSYPEGIAVDNDPLSTSYGDVYVVDRRNNRVEKFNADGSFLLMMGGDVNGNPSVTDQNICTAAEALNCQAGTEGVSDGQFTWASEGSYIAVGSEGKIYVGDNESVQTLSPEGTYQSRIALPGAGETRALAVNAEGDLYVESAESPGVHRYDPAGVEVETLDTNGSPRSIALNPSGQQIFIDDGEDSEGQHHIFEYNASGKQLTSFDGGGEGGSRGIAFSERTGALYVVNSKVLRAVMPPGAGPLVVRSSAVNLAPATATLSATIVPEGHEASYHFEYGTTANYGTSEPIPDQGIGGGFEEQSASVNLTRLSPSTVYHFRVVATDTEKNVTYGPDVTFSTLPPALIDGEWASHVDTESAALNAAVNPLGHDTTYHFEYGPSASYGAVTPSTDTDIGSGTSDVALSRRVQGLRPGKLYHYRVVATNGLGTIKGADRLFITQSTTTASTLLDARQWELVSPPVKGEGQIEAQEPIHSGGAVLQAAADGDAITYVANAPLLSAPAGNRGPENQQILSTRGANGWTSEELATPNDSVTGHISTGNLSEYKAFSPNLSLSVLEPQGETPLSSDATEKTSYLRDESGSFLPLLTQSNTPPGIKYGGLENFVGATPDLMHLVISSSAPLVVNPKLTAGVENLYEWTAGHVELVSVLPDGSPAITHNEEALLGYSDNNVRHAVSNDGQRVVFSSVGGHLYLRDIAKQVTVQLDAAQGVREPLQSGAHFQSGSENESKVFFTDEQHLTADSTAKENAPDLYVCEIVEVSSGLVCHLKDLSVDNRPNEPANVGGGVIGTSENGLRVYFVAQGVLTVGQNVEGESARPASPNLYMLENTGTSWRPPVFIAGLSSEDAPTWDAPVGINFLTARVSPNGQWLAFMSDRSLTGYDNVDVNSGRPDEEVFLFDASANRLLCASCDSSGARPTGVFDPPGVDATPLLIDRAKTWAGRWLAGSIPGWTGIKEGSQGYYQSRYLSNSGRLFFNTPDALSPQDINGMMDAYEYEPEGVGACAEGDGPFQESLPGCVALLSSGTSEDESAFLDASVSGEDAFFLTSAQLVTADHDKAFDVYDARECNGTSACPTAALASPPACATADACRGVSAAPPTIFGSPASSTFAGVGNIGASITAKKVVTRALTRAQKLAKALKTCSMESEKRHESKKRHAACVRQAKKKYGPGIRKKGKRKMATRHQVKTRPQLRTGA